MTGRPALALFDLDHTLIPFDSGLAWSRFLMQQGHLPPGFEAGYLEYARQYARGTLDFHALHRWTLAPFAAVPMATLRSWRHDFAAQLPSRLPAAARMLLQRHRQAGDLCAIVTATSRFVSDPFAQALGAPHLVATESEVVDGCFSGAIVGEPCFRAGKIAHVQRWLAAQGRAWGDFGRSVFYSDSSNDLPMLSTVGHPHAVNPDGDLRDHAREHGWPVHDFRTGRKVT
ncbi:MAG TPA: HAD family hydrolase, partial [Burkholderiaceae bacterium]|nr:HAD family hydrolase [Burkholderiaceae bacterium]